MSNLLIHWLLLTVYIAVWTIVYFFVHKRFYGIRNIGYNIVVKFLAPNFIFGFFLWSFKFLPNFIRESGFKLSISAFILIIIFFIFFNKKFPVDGRKRTKQTR